MSPRTGRPPSDDPRRFIVRTRITKDEDADVLAAAAELGQSVSDWLRDAAAKAVKAQRSARRRSGR